jgi:hypothetical protein
LAAALCTRRFSTNEIADEAQAIVDEKYATTSLRSWSRNIRLFAGSNLFFRLRRWSLGCDAGGARLCEEDRRVSERGIP